MNGRLTEPREGAKRAVRNYRILAGLFSIAFSVSLTNPCFAVAQEAPVPSAPTFSLSSPALNQKGLSYKMSPDDSTWKEFLEGLRVYLSDGRTMKAPAATVIQQNKALKDIQARVLDAGGARVWTFPGVPSNHCLVIQSGGAANAEGFSVAKASIVAIPENVNITAAKIVRSFTTTTQTIKVRRKTITKTVKVEGPSLLAVAGLDRVTGLVYLGGYKPVAGAWVSTSEPFSQIPSHFLQTLSGQASFNGNDLVLAVSSQNGQASETPATTAPASTALPKPKSSSYQIVMKFVGGHFILSGSPAKDMPLQIVSYFMQCVRLNRMDLAKAWLADPSLISIPKYVNLIGKNSETYKLVAMSQPGRFRCVTNGRDDLIFDVGRAGIKKEVLIKGIFIAPPDPLAKSLTGTLIGAPPPPPPTTDSTATTSAPVPKPN